MSDLRIEHEYSAGPLVAHGPDSDGDMAIYVDYGEVGTSPTAYLDADGRRQLIDWLIRYTEDMIV